MRNQITEQILTTKGLPFTYSDAVSIPDLDGDEVHQIRLGDTDPHNVSQMVQLLQSGGQLPAIVLADVAGAVRLIDGIHRIRAHKQVGRQTIDAYSVVLPDDAALEAMRRSANVSNGKGLTLDERIQHAVRLVKNGHSAVTAASTMGLSHSTIGLYLRADTCRQRIAETMPTFAGTSALTVKVLNLLRPITRQEVFQAAVHAAYERKLTEDAVQVLRDEAMKAITDSDAQSLIAKWQRDRPVKPLRSSHPAARLESAVLRLKGSVTSWDKQTKGGMSDDGRNEAINALRWVAREFSSRADALEADTGRN